MTSPLEHNIDLEAQHGVPHPSGVGRSEIDATGIPLGLFATKSNAPPLDQDVNIELQPILSQNAVGFGESAIQEDNVDQSEQDGRKNNNLPTRVEKDEIQTDEQTRTRAEPGVDPRITAMEPPPGGSGPPTGGGIVDSQSEEKRMIGDFNGSAHTLWALYGKEAKSYDEARVQTLKEDMDGVLIFAGLFATALTAFIIDSKQSLKSNPADQTVYYLQQNVAILDQISRQISSIAPQVSINSTAPPPFPAFKPSASDIRINVFWFMALVFSLSAAFLAILVQQWVRDYMHVFQRYSDPLKSARLRQYFHEGSEGWYMPVVAEAVPALLHVSLFLFLVGLCDFILNINTAVGISTTLPIAVIGLLYALTTFAPIKYPQSPYQNPFSVLIWYLIQKSGRGRQYKDRGSDGAPKLVSPNMAQGQMQLAMEESEERKGRDERAIRWLIGNMTEDAEMESFVMAIPGTFDCEWGKEVWKKISSTIDDEDKSRGHNEPAVVPSTDTDSSTIIPPVVKPSLASFVRTTTLLPIPLLADAQQHFATAHIQEEDVIRGLTARVSRLLATCRNRGLFASDELWRKRTRGCIETTASLVFCAGAELDRFGDMAKLLGDIGSDQRMRESSSVGRDQLFVARWTCLSLMAIRPVLESDVILRGNVGQALQMLNDITGDEQTLTRSTRVEEIIETFDKVARYLDEIRDALRWEENLTEENAREILQNYEPQISELEHIHIQNDSLGDVDRSISIVQHHIDKSIHGIITHQFPGLMSDNLNQWGTESVHYVKFIELFRDPHKYRFIFPVRNLKRICSITHKFQDILERRSDVRGDAWLKTLDDLRELVSLCKQHGNLLHRQAWRLQDLSDGGGLGFTVELFFVALKQLLSTSLSKDSHSELLIATFRAITSDRSVDKSPLGTQMLLLDLILPYRSSMSDFDLDPDPDSGSDFDFDYPAYIIEAFLAVLSKVFEGQKGAHINNFVQRLTDAISRFSTSAPPPPLLVGALKVIARSCSSSP